MLTVPALFWVMRAPPLEALNRLILCHEMVRVVNNDVEDDRTLYNTYPLKLQWQSVVVVWELSPSITDEICTA